MAVKSKNARVVLKFEHIDYKLRRHVFEQLLFY